MSLKSTRGGKLPELVPNHIFRDQYRYVLPTIMDSNRQSNKIRRNSGPSGPCFDGSLAALRLGALHLHRKVMINKWPLFDRAWHFSANSPFPVKLRGSASCKPTCQYSPVKRAGVTTRLRPCCRLALHSSLFTMLPFAPPKNHRIRAFVKSRFVALGRNTPRRDRVTSTRGPAFAAPVRVIDRVHRHTSHSGANSTPAFGTGFAQLAQGMLGVSDLAYSGPAIYVNLASFSRPQAQLPLVTFTRDELDGCDGAASQLGPCARFQLHAMNQASQWDVTQR